MKILNKILKYFETETTQAETYDKTTVDNVQDKNTSFYLDNEIQGLKRSIDLINKVLKPIEIPFPENDYLLESRLTFRRWNNLIVLYGDFYPKTTIQKGQEIIITTLPNELRPSQDIWTFAYSVNIADYVRIRILKSGVIEVYVYGDTPLVSSYNTQLNVAYCNRTQIDFNEQ